MPLEAKPVRDLTRADVLAVVEARRQALADARAALDTVQATDAANATRPKRERVAVPVALRRQAALAQRADKQGEVGIARLMARLRHLLNWAVADGVLDASPFRRAGVVVVKASAHEAPRTRRLKPGEEDRLLHAASAPLRALIVAALSTGCRVGELLSLTWGQVKRDATGEARYVELPGTNTKTGAPRVVPVGTKLRAVLALLRYDAAGHEHPATAHVFGHGETGERVASIKTGWRLACRRAGVRGLRFHDLRREFACRLLESRAELHDVRAFLGHANIATTSRYLHATPVRLERALARMEAEPEAAPALAQPATVPLPPVPASVN